ncbi:BnaA04g25340D [Brassica napus]|uniref:BnaA04g25340D protein n=1 Tax=Brassica napus TaxID=3708 RepID=A0A078H0T4_BRANA|nr:BnaA04g25340D [Brassica napus]
MGKKGSLFSAIKSVFTPQSKEKLGNEAERKSGKEKSKKKGFGKLRRGESSSFLPIFREPSSIEKILAEAERDHNLVFRPPTPPDQSNPPSASPPPPLRPASPHSPLKPGVLSPKPTSPRVPPPRAEPLTLDTPRTTTPKPLSPRAELREEIVSRPEPTLFVQHASATKIQAAFRGYTARRSFRALKGLVRLQGIVKGYSVKRQTVNAMKYMQKLVRVQSKIQSHRIRTSENQTQVEKDAVNDHWDDSVLTKEERDARSQRKADAIIKRERSMAYAYSHKVTPKSAHDVGLPLWWNWGDQQLPLASPAPSHYMLTPIRLSPRYSRGRLRGGSPFKDDDSLTSCPPFPSYMAPTLSAKAKVRPNSNPKERVMGTPSSVSSEKRRVSYPQAQRGQDVFRWNKGSLLMSNKGGPGSSSPGGVVVLEKRKTVKSVGNLSVDSTVSMSSKPFNRYV